MGLLISWNPLLCHIPKMQKALSQEIAAQRFKRAQRSVSRELHESDAHVFWIRPLQWPLELYSACDSLYEFILFQYILYKYNKFNTAVRSHDEFMWHKILPLATRLYGTRRKGNINKRVKNDVFEIHRSTMTHVLENQPLMRACVLNTRIIHGSWSRPYRTPTQL